MLTTLAKLEAKIGDKLYHFLLDTDAQIQDAKQALYQFLGYINQVEENVKAQQAQAATQPAPEAPVENKVEPLPKE